MAVGHLQWDQEELFDGKNQSEKISGDGPFKEQYGMKRRKAENRKNTGAK